MVRKKEATLIKIKKILDSLQTFAAISVSKLVKKPFFKKLALQWSTEKNWLKNRIFDLFKYCQNCKNVSV